MIALFLAIALDGAALEPALAPEPAPVELADADQDLLRQARSLRYAQRWYEAAQAYRTYIQEFPGSGRVADARFWLAATLESDQRWDEAAEAYGDFLARHPEQRLLGKEARLNRLRCWGIRQGQNPTATAGLLAALQDPSAEVQIAAALQLAKSGARRAVPGLRKGLEQPGSAEACSLALVAMGVKPAQAGAPGQARFLVIRIREQGQAEAVTIRLAMVLARAVTGYLSDAQLREARAKGVDLDNLTERAATLPKGTVLFSVDDPKSSITVTVE